MRLEETRNQRVIAGVILTVLGLVLDITGADGLITGILYVGAWLIAGIDVVLQAVVNVKNNRLFAEHFLMSIATIGALAIGEYMEAALVMVLYQIGELLQDRAIDRSRKSIADLMDIMAPIAYRLEGDTRVEVDPDEIEVGDLLEMRSGERVPVDGVIIEGRSTLDTSALTGESYPKSVKADDQILSGSINGEGRLIVRATAVAQDSTASRIIDLIEEATENKAETESYITKFAKVYTPIVVVLAIIIAFIIPLFVTGGFSQDWFIRGLTFLVISCPCAFVISVPMSFVIGIGVGSRLGILVKGGNVFEKLSEVKILAMDKTGTLTKGKFEVSDLHAVDKVDERALLSLAREMELGSTHPIALAIVRHADHLGATDLQGLKEIESLSGKGIQGSTDQGIYVAGNALLMREYNLEDAASEDACHLQAATVIHLAQVEPRIAYLGHFVIQDTIKENAEEVINDLRTLGIEEIVMLTGDAKLVADEVGTTLQLDETHAELLPQDKLNWVKEKNDESQRKLAFAGDGLNDAPVLAISDVSIAMGGIGSDAAIEVSDVVLINDDLASIVRAIDLAKVTLTIARQNIAISLGIKVIFLILSAFGLIPMWAAVFGDVGVTLIAIANSFRIYSVLSKYKTTNQRATADLN